MRLRSAIIEGSTVSMSTITDSSSVQLPVLPLELKIAGGPGGLAPNKVCGISKHQEDTRTSISA